jgi:hypothetical protein
MSDSNNNGGVGVLTVVGISFVILKLVGVIAWSWWLVTLPFTAPFAIVLCILMIAGVAALIKKAVE